MEKKFHEKMVECKVFSILEEEGIVTLFSGFEEKYLGDALFKGKGKITLLEFKAITGKKNSTICNKEKEKFSNFERYLKALETLKSVPHILVIGELLKENLKFEGGNYASFLKKCPNLSRSTIISFGEEKLKTGLLELIKLFGTDKFEEFLKYVTILVKTRLNEDETSSGSSSFQEKVKKLLTGVKVVISKNGKLFVSTLGNLIAFHPKFEEELSKFLDIYIKNLKQNLSTDLNNHIRNDLWRNNNSPKPGPSL